MIERNSDEWMEYVSRELVAADKRTQAHAEEIALLKKQVEGMQSLLTENARAVQQIAGSISEMLDVFSSWKGAMRTLEMVGKLAKPVAAIISVAVAIGAAYTTWRGIR